MYTYIHIYVYIYIDIHIFWECTSVKFFFFRKDLLFTEDVKKQGMHLASLGPCHSHTLLNRGVTETHPGYLLEKQIAEKTYQPGDSSRDLFIPGSLNLWKGHVFTISKRSPAELPGQEKFIEMYTWKTSCC